MSHEPLVTNLTLLYQTFAALHYISPTDIFSPPTTVNLDAATEAALSSEAIALLQRLPQLNPDLYSLPILPNGSQSVFYDDGDLDWSRRPTFQPEPEISKHAFVLSNPNIYGTSLIYDTTSEKLLPWEAWGKHVDLEIAEIENPFEMDDAKPVEQIMGPWIEKLLRLDWVPFGEELITEPDEANLVAMKGDVDVLEHDQLRFIKSSLRNVYLAAGWNDTANDLETAKKEFDGDLFEIKKLEWMKRTQEILDQAYDEGWTWSRIRTDLGLANSGKVTILDDWLPEGEQMRHIGL
ncbi:unnamed protein product [Aureobasidium vineae]|uniref:Uncharacterized protein n=1 Tax=Aureobasidium vineae TaxID=2773715 RepID=A0A9N8JU77_9PEZI|nr:unnamed protein product [Aureobasidium vineae]